MLSLPFSVASILGMLYLASGTLPYQLGLTARHWGKNLFVGIISAISVVPVVYLILYLVDWFDAARPASRRKSIPSPS